MKMLSQNSITMMIFWMCGWLFSIAFAKPISQGALKSALESMDPTQLAMIQRNVQALSAMAAKVMPTVYGDGGKHSRLTSPSEDEANDEGDDETDSNYDSQNYLSADDIDYQDDEFEEIYNTLKYEAMAEENDNIETENEFMNTKDNEEEKSEFVNAKDNDEEEKVSSADASKDNDKKKPSSAASKDNDKKKLSSDASKDSEKKATEPKGEADEKEKKKP